MSVLAFGVAVAIAAAVWPALDGLVWVVSWLRGDE